MFSPRLTLPEAGNPYYNRTASGGYNPCIAGNPKTRVKGLDVLPNCVGYATGRFAEIIGEPRCEYLGNTNACNYITLARRQGLLISNAPTAGGVMVWSGGAGGYGHVAVVEATIGTDTVVTSESEYFGAAFVVYTRRRSGGNWRQGCYWMDSTYKYLGCIVNPGGKEDPVTYEQFCEYMNRYLAELAGAPADKWAEPAINFCKEKGIMVGDSSGNFRPQSPLKREELAAVLMSLF